MTVLGAAIGGGVTILLHCDLALTVEGTLFQFPFVSLSVVPEFASAPSNWTMPSPSPSTLRCRGRTVHQRRSLGNFSRDFDQSYDAINGLTYECTASHYAVSAGDTLESIAQTV